MTTSRALRRVSAAATAAALGLAGVALTAQPAAAATFTVVNTNDAGLGSLRAAVESANAAPGADTIEFADTVSGTLTLLAPITFSGPVSVQGPGADVLTVARDGGFDSFLYDSVEAGDFAVSGLAFRGDAGGEFGRAVYVDGIVGAVVVSSSTFTDLVSNGDGPALYVDNATSVSVTDVAATDNESSNGGGAFAFGSDFPVVGPVTLRNVVAESNTAEHGGAVRFGDVEGDVTIEESSFTSNAAEAAAGALYLDDLSGSFTATGTVFSTNTAAQGGAILADGIHGSLTLSKSSFLENSAVSAGGGGLVLGVAGATSITEVIFDGNTAGEGIGGFGVGAPIGATAITDSVFTGNQAGQAVGGLLLASGSADATIRGTTFEGNTATQVGGGLLITGSGDEPADITVVDSTFSENTAAQGAGLAGFTGNPLEDGSAGITIERSSFFDNVAVPTEGYDAYGESAFLDVSEGGLARVVNSTFDEESDEAEAPYAIATASSSGGSVEVIHSTVRGPGAIASGIALTLDDEEADAVAVLASHDILESTTDAEALGAVELLYDNSPVRGVLPGTEMAAPSRAEASAAAGSLLADDFFTLEWSIVSTEITPEIVTEGEGNQLETDPRLGALADNGGLTLTRAPQASSPAIGQGDPAVTGAPATDQRGAARVVDVIDVGAVEQQAPTLAATGGTVNYALLIGGAVVLLLGVAAIVFAALRRRRSSSPDGE